MRVVGRAAWPLLACAPLAASACGSKDLPLGEALVIVDTDMPVPKIVSRLRIDFYTEDGTWYETRDVGGSAPSAWPVSFGVYLAEGETARRTILRLRAYPEGQVRAYRGERFQGKPTGGDPTALVPDPSDTSGPRLLDAGGADITPPSEPAPLVSIDRLALIHLVPGVRGSARIVLRGACDGTMADLGDFSAPATCVDTEDARSPLADEPLDPDMTLPTSTQAGSFEAPYVLPCTQAARRRTTAADGTPLYDEDVCVQGGVFLFGSRDDALGDPSDDLPERIATVSSFFMDRYEVTVGRLRAALASGALARSGSPLANDGPLGDPSTDENASDLCTFSSSPQGREDFPATCIDQVGARAFCQAMGGDLPQEVEWEYAATMSARAAKTHYPWGDGTAPNPACTDVVYSRSNQVGVDDGCSAYGFGPASVTAVEHAGGDVSIGLSIVNLGGDVSEWMLEPYASLEANCWAESSMASRTCAYAGASTWGARGGTWNFTPDAVLPAVRQTSTGPSTGVGFRCVRSGSAP